METLSFDFTWLVPVLVGWTVASFGFALVMGRLIRNGSGPEVFERPQPPASTGREDDIASLEEARRAA